LSDKKHTKKKRPWLPLYVADYLRDTSHLRAAESGAYLHLIMAYWVNGGLPDDDRQLATIAKVTDREWKKMRPTLEKFFGSGFTSHKRIDLEIWKAAEISEANSSKARDAANARWHPSSMPEACSEHPSSNAPVCTLHSTHIDDDDDEQPAPLVSEEANRLSDEIAKVCGHDLKFLPPSWLGAPYRVQTWIANGWPPEVVLASCREQMARKRDGPPGSVQYFEKGIAGAIAKQNAPLPEVKIIEAQTVEVRRGTTENLAQTAKRMSAEVIGFGPRPSLTGGGENGNSVRMLPKGGSE
jgi:uncharacterized protein YdaU (DUF1376 family)